VRHAYLTGAEEPYDEPKRALRAEIDEAAWSCLYRTVRRAFPRPESERIAVKVISHYGDEVLSVWRVRRADDPRSVRCTERHGPEGHGNGGSPNSEPGGRIHAVGSPKTPVRPKMPVSGALVAVHSVAS
jgi:hypothetical protein